MREDGQVCDQASRERVAQWGCWGCFIHSVIGNMCHKALARNQSQNKCAVGFPGKTGCSVWQAGVVWTGYSVPFSVGQGKTTVSTSRLSRVQAMGFRTRGKAVECSKASQGPPLVCTEA